MEEKKKDKICMYIFFRIFIITLINIVLAYSFLNGGFINRVVASQKVTKKSNFKNYEEEKKHGKLSDREKIKENLKKLNNDIQKNVNKRIKTKVNSIIEGNKNFIKGTDANSNKININREKINIEPYKKLLNRFNKKKLKKKFLSIANKNTKQKNQPNQPIFKEEENTSIFNEENEDFQIKYLEEENEENEDFKIYNLPVVGGTTGFCLNDIFGIDQEFGNMGKLEKHPQNEYILLKKTDENSNKINKRYSTCHEKISIDEENSEEYEYSCKLEENEENEDFKIYDSPKATLGVCLKNNPECGNLGKLEENEDFQMEDLKLEHEKSILISSEEYEELKMENNFIKNNDFNILINENNKIKHELIEEITRESGTLMEFNERLMKIDYEETNEKILNHLDESSTRVCEEKELNEINNNELPNNSKTRIFWDINCKNNYEKSNIMENEDEEINKDSKVEKNDANYEYDDLVNI